MLMFDCKKCGKAGGLAVAEGATVGTCRACGGVSTLPGMNDEKIEKLFNRADQLRRQYEFDKAMQACEHILEEDPDNAEAHWCMVLCRYGIEYVKDPRTEEYVPTCHRGQTEPILADADYRAAMEHADDETRPVYEAEARQISEIQKGIQKISDQEEPYDVFICYKEKPIDGDGRTIDSTIAEDMYDRLTQSGYRVFFARITLEDKLGQPYEPYIFSALNSAKVMLLIGTKKEHFEAVWVKNEWSRYLALMKKDRSRRLIPCYRDMDYNDLPIELTNLKEQAQDMSKTGFDQDILRGLKKILDAGKPTVAPVVASPERPASSPPPAAGPAKTFTIHWEKRFSEQWGTRYQISVDGWSYGEIKGGNTLTAQSRQDITTVEIARTTGMMKKKLVLKLKANSETKISFHTDSNGWTQTIQAIVAGAEILEQSIQPLTPKSSQSFWSTVKGHLGIATAPPAASPSPPAATPIPPPIPAPPVRHPPPTATQPALPVAKLIATPVPPPLPATPARAPRQPAANQPVAPTAAPTVTTTSAPDPQREREWEWEREKERRRDEERNREKEWEREEKRKREEERKNNRGILYVFLGLLGIMAFAAFMSWRTGGFDKKQPAQDTPSPAAAPKSPRQIASSGDSSKFEAWAESHGLEVHEEDGKKRTLAHFAAAEGRVDVLKWLKSQGMNVNAKDNDGATPLFIAASQGHVEVMEWLKGQGASIHARDQQGMTPIIAAAAEGQVEAMKWLKEQGVDIRAGVGEANMTPMHAATGGSQIEVMTWLKEQGVDIHAVDASGAPPMFVAAVHGQIEAMQWLKTQGVDIHAVGGEANVTPMHVAAVAGHVEFMKWLKAQGADVNTMDLDGRTPLSWTNDAAARKWLLANGARDGAASPSPTRNAPVKTAAVAYDAKACEAWADTYGLRLHEKDSKGRTLAHFAAEKGRMDVLKWLQSEGMDVNAKESTNLTPIFFAAKEGHVETMKWLKKQGADVRSGDFSGTTPMHLAAQGNHVEAMMWLKEQGASIHAKGVLDRTPIFFAAKEGHIDAMMWLKEQGADINVSDKIRRTPLSLIDIPMHRAAATGQIEAMKWLKEQGADVNTKDSFEQTAMFVAANRGHVNVMVWLKEQGANINAREKTGKTPMFAAARGGKIEAMKWLKDQGVDINAKCDEGLTPIFRAALAGHVEAMAWMKEQGADINAKANDGTTPLSVAGSEEAKQWLRANGAKE